MKFKKFPRRTLQYHLIIYMNPLVKFDHFVVKYNKIFRLLFFPAIVILSLLLLVDASEYINVGVLKNTDGYPWGCHCFDGMDHYASPELYSATMLYEGLFFLTGIVISVYFAIKQRSFYPLFGIIIYVLFKNI